jgi:nitrogen fixation protein NifU and related proteins
MTDILDPSWMGDDEIYKENILDHFKHPHNKGTLDDYTFNIRKHNPVCGDNIELFVKVEDRIVKDVKFNGNGCAISVAAASMLTEKIKNMNLQELENLKESEVLEMIGVPLGVVRVKCGLLSFKILKEGLKKMEIKNEQVTN